MEQMNIVIAGHVDHGKSTVIGRLLADTGSLPEGKLESIKERCKRESKQFEYAFLLDALKDEQSQGITIDSARCFFRTNRRSYIIIDAPGHIEFLKNMISGAARAEAALLVIDANEGVKENSKRHGYMLSMLGIRQIAVCVNKMDLVDYRKDRFDSIVKEYSDFLKKIDVRPKSFIPISALQGDNITKLSKNLRWYNGKTVLEKLDSFEKEDSPKDKPLRLPVQDIYKFTGNNDSRRIIAGRVESGTIREGDRIVFFPSGKRTAVKTIEAFNNDSKTSASAGESTGITLEEQIYARRGDIIAIDNGELPEVSTLIKANIFWMGKEPMKKGKEYKIKICTSQSIMRLKEITGILDASDLSKKDRDSIGRHEVAECMIECISPLAFDHYSTLQATGRFVIVDGYDISGGGIITGSEKDKNSEIREQVFVREKRWDKSIISSRERSALYGQNPKLVFITGKTGIDKKTIAKELEKKLFMEGRKAYFLGIGNLLRGLDSDIEKVKRKEHLRRLGEVANILMDAGLIVIATASDVSDDELKLLQTINSKNHIITVSVGKEHESDGLIDLFLSQEDDNETNVNKISDVLRQNNVMFDI